MADRSKSAQTHIAKMVGKKFGHLTLTLKEWCGWVQQVHQHLREKGLL